MRSPLEFNDPFDSAFALSEKGRRQAFDFVESGSVLESLFNAFDHDQLDFSMTSAQKQAFIHERKLLLSRLRKDPHYVSVPFFDAYVRSTLKRHGETKDVIEENYQHYCQLIERSIQQTQSEILISCFSQRNDSILMWSHYADAHHGVCLGFAEPDDPKFHRVNYSNQKPFLDLTDISSLLVGKRLLGERIEKFDSETLDKVAEPFYQKSRDWSYEEEIRCVYTIQSNGEKIIYRDAHFFLQMSPIQMVYFGCRAAGPEVGALKRLLRHKNIPFITMKESEKEYRIIPG